MVGVGSVLFHGTLRHKMQLLGKLFFSTFFFSGAAVRDARLFVEPWIEIMKTLTESINSWLFYVVYR